MQLRSTAALVLAGAAALLLRKVQQQSTPALDLRLFPAVHGRGPDAWRNAVFVLAHPGAVAGKAALVALAARRSPRVAACIVLSPMLAIGVSRTLKTLTSRPRPPLRLIGGGSRFDSFPSSHTAGEAALAWAVASALPMPPRARAAFMVLALVDIALVGSARVAEGAHWPTDAMAAIGIAVSEGIMALLRPREGEPAASSPPQRGIATTCPDASSELEAVAM